MKRLFIMSGVGLSLILIAAAILWPQEPAPLEFNDIRGISVLSPAHPMNSFGLITHDNQPFSTSDLKNQWSIMFFGFTHCPDVCPTTLNALSQSLPQLHGHTEANNRYYMVTLDPARDTAARLKEYVGYFSPDFIGITGEKNQIDAVATHNGIIYDYEGDLSSGDYIVNHYSALLVVDPQARVRAHILPPHTQQRIATAFNRIVEYYGN